MTTSTAISGAGRRPAPLSLLVICLGYFMVILDATTANLSLPALGRDLGGVLGTLQWVVDGTPSPSRPCCWRSCRPSIPIRPPVPAWWVGVALLGTFAISGGMGVAMAVARRVPGGRAGGRLGGAVRESPG